jgi:hypothetical protein
LRRSNRRGVDGKIYGEDDLSRLKN